MPDILHRAGIKVPPPTRSTKQMAMCRRGQGMDRHGADLAQRGWKEPVEFMHYCSIKWAVFMLSPKIALLKLA
jgi:hypothetical protein